MGTCATCKHWAFPAWDKDDTFGLCQAMPDDKTGWEESDSLAQTFASNDIGSGLQTKAEFGCVLWASKEPENPL